MALTVDELDPQLRPLIGSVLVGRFEIRAPIAVGAMGTVFVGRHLALERDVAVKVLCPTLARAHSYAARFEREAQSLSRLDHPNCLRVFDYGVTDSGLHFLVTEWIEGVELAALMGGAVDPATAVARTLQVLAGLEHAHERGVVHRDLKPQNVLVARDKHGGELLKIVDFGIAKLIGPSTSALTGANMVFGTPQYMSPEQASGGAVDHRADLYATGVLLYTMLTGALPFDGDDPIVVTRLQIHEPVPLLPACVPPSIRVVVQRLLAKDPAARYASAVEVAAALQRAAPTLAPTARVPHHRAGARPRGRVQGAELARLGVAVAVVGLVVATGLRAPRDEQPSEPHDRLATMTVQDADRLLAHGATARAREVLATLLDQDPTNPELLWRDGRALARAHEWKRGLDRYAQALAADGQLREDPRFFSELDALMRRPELESEAIDVALRHLDGFADRFLVDTVNRPRRPLDYVDRHRVLAHLRLGELADEVDGRHNAYLDLRQADAAPEPCAAYLHGLESLVAQGAEPPDLDVVTRTEVPTREVEDDEACGEARDLRQRILVGGRLLEELDEGDEADEADTRS